MTKLIQILIIITPMFLMSYNAQAQQIKVIDVKNFKQVIENKKVQLVDVRTPKEYRLGHLNKAININVFSLFFNVEALRLNKTQPVYIYCRSGVRSANAAKRLKNLGFTKIYDLKGGINAWKAENLSITK